MSATFAIPDFTGDIYLPGTDEFNAARKVHNGMIDRKPVAIARPKTADDVAAAVKHAFATSLPVTIYGGGHSVQGLAVGDGALCIDMRGMRNVTVDPVARTARAEGGANWGDFDNACFKEGFASVGGRVPSTGVAGLALGGGSGWLERAYGTTADQMVEVELVTADGRKVVASEAENPDLFWALHGGGSNFGVVTAITLRIHPMPPLSLGGMLIFGADKAHEAARFCYKFIESGDGKLCGGLAMVTAPPAPFVPLELQGKPVLAVLAFFAGTVEEGEAALAEMRAFGPPDLDLVQPMPYIAFQDIVTPGFPAGVQVYWASDTYGEFNVEGMDAFVTRGLTAPSPLTQSVLIPFGTAVTRSSREDLPMGQADAKSLVHYMTMWTDPADDEKNITWTREFARAMKPYALERVYLNFLGDEGEGRVKEGHGHRYKRLQEVKAKWDPTNFFRCNHNIKPSEA